MKGRPAHAYNLILAANWLTDRRLNFSNSCCVEMWSFRVVLFKHSLNFILGILCSSHIDISYGFLICYSEICAQLQPVSFSSNWDAAISPLKGLLFFLSVFWPFFSIGITMASFHASGNTPVSMEVFIMWVSGIMRESIPCSRQSWWIPSAIAKSINQALSPL